MAIKIFDTPAARRKWTLQRAAQSILRETVPRIDRFGNERNHYKYRVAMCHRGTDGLAPEVRRMDTGERAEFFGVQTCGSVWTCPICASKIATERRNEMRKAMAAHHDAGGSVYFATYTFQHTAEEGGAGCLAGQLTKLRELMSKKLTNSRLYKDWMKEAGSIGAIRAMEVTYGELNGWHPHIHQLIFADKTALEVSHRQGRVRYVQTIYRRSALGRIRKLWARILIKEGMAGLKDGDTGAELIGKLRTLLQRCFTVQCGSYADDYIAKFGREGEEAAWGAADELSKGHTKTPKRTNRVTPWGMLVDFLNGDKRSAWLFREYAEAFHGKAQLFWSKGLKARFLINELSDDDVAATPEMRCNETVIKLSDPQWSLILSRNARFDILAAAAKDGRMGVLVKLSELETIPARWSAEFNQTGQAFVPIGGVRGSR